MKIIIRAPFTGILAFVIVLLTMPLGHVLMIVMEKVFGQRYIFPAAVLTGIAGLLMFIPALRTKNKTMATFWGLFSGLLVWTGWIEFAFVYYARRYAVAPLIENGAVVTKPEYLIMPASVGFWAVLMVLYLVGTKNVCPFFLWIQKTLGLSKVAPKSVSNKNFAIVTFLEIITLLWTFYLVLLFCYDNNFLGDHHWITYFVAYGSLLWSVILFFRLVKIHDLGYAIRYAIPTVIIFWNFIEVMGRWNILKEIWVEPGIYWLEILLMVVVFFILTILGFWSKKTKIHNPHMSR